MAAASRVTGMAAEAASRAVAARGVHLKIFPRPRNLTESRQVLKVMQSVGEVDMFQMLKFEMVPASNTAHVLFKSPQAAEQAIFKSPIRFVMNEPVGSSPRDVSNLSSASDLSSSVSTQAEAASTETETTIRYPPMTLPSRNSTEDDLDDDDDDASPRRSHLFTPPPIDPQLEPRDTAIYISAARWHHEAAIKRGYYYAGFPTGSKPGVRPGSGIFGNGLPPGMDGLGNWEIRKGDKGWGARMRQRTKARERGKAGLTD